MFRNTLFTDSSVVKRAGLIAVALGMFAPLMAHAQGDHPPLMPARDAVVTYSVQPEGAPDKQEVKVWFASEGARMRIDSPDGAASTVLNRTAQSVMIILHKQRVFTLLTDRGAVRNPFLLDVSMQYKKNGHTTIAGIDCTRWIVTSGKGQADACVTDNGLILSESGVDADGLKGQLTALSVSYETIPSTEFEAPSGYQQVRRHRINPDHAPAGPVLGPDSGPPAPSSPAPASGD
ncbi:DUF4412 domain-containing protein [Acetobacter oeni]|uniref:DUF4412 domain-containing protein n=1 Tax=Acetobacter oeni TaxID=304077 RepID=A0A511XG42_9PROT|nr:DUF4412 domain-containing protein [Acetobacter oeni]MBB3882155.1 hypothetical protein [Acetobacter oeni]NHO17915.1 DUF4412 domain-containing protein [Acetobacter oeni]GBR01502.1 hypothetical protein AA21952_0444 [Acetobacter oeni LMG 21952]GEN61924.1 hypothetical protein AOE01nite_01480 [Acetobacter oeni]